MSDLKHVMFDGISELEPEQLVEVANDAATIHQMVMDEFAAREARTAAAKAAAAALKPGGAAASAKKRGPKPKDAKTAASEPPPGWSEAETVVELDAE
jgi:hypothetical protein